MFYKSLLLSLSLLTSSTLLANEKKTIDLALEYGSVATTRESSIVEFMKISAYKHILNEAKHLDCALNNNYNNGVCSFIYKAKTKEETIDAMHDIGISVVHGKEKEKAACMFLLMSSSAGDFSSNHIANKMSGENCEHVKNLTSEASELQKKYEEVRNVDIN